MLEFIVGTLAVLDFAILLAALLYWLALDCFKDVPEAQHYIALVNRGIRFLKSLVNLSPDQNQKPNNHNDACQCHQNEQCNLHPKNFISNQEAKDYGYTPEEMRGYINDTFGKPKSGALSEGEVKRVITAIRNCEIKKGADA